MRNGLIIIEIPEYNGPGVYSLADQNGKQYIGSSLNVSQRIVQHDRSLIDAKNGYIQKTLSSYKMQLAVQDGMTFKASVLWELPDGGTQYDLWDAERRFLLLAGGCKETYNTKDVPNYRKDDFSGLRAWRNHAPSRRRDEAIAIFLEHIEKRSAPISARRNVRKSRDNIMIRPTTEEGAKIRKAAADAGKSVQAYILDILREHIT